MRLPVVLVAVAALSLAALSAGCAELDLLLPVGSGTPLSTSTDPAVQAAGASSEAVDKVREAEGELNKALETKDIKHLDKAIALRPFDPSYLHYRAALLVAEHPQDRSPVDVYRDLGAAAGLFVDRFDHTPGIREDDKGTEARTSALISLVDALAVTKTRYARDSVQWRRLNHAYCSQLEELKDWADTSLTSELYSDEDCPK